MPLFFSKKKMATTNKVAWKTILVLVCSWINLNHAKPTPVDTTICKPYDSLNYSMLPPGGIDLYYINLERRTDRNDNVQAEFKLHNILPPQFNTHRFNAVDGKTHSFSPEEEALFTVFYEKGLGGKANEAVLKSNSLSHLGVWRKIVESKAPLAIIVQDDVQFKNCFVEDFLEVLQFNPPDALVTWIGINAFADGPVSRSAILSRNKYDPDFFSKLLEHNSGGVMGMARKAYIATGSLAYIVTAAGARALVNHFGEPEGVGWTHHTDHAMVEFLDSKNVSYISRNILATTYDDGLFGSDIFPTEKQLLLEYTRIQRLVETLCRLPHLPNSEKGAVQLEEALQQPLEMLPTNPIVEGLAVKIEESACYNPGCPNNRQTTVYLTWGLGNGEPPTRHRVPIFLYSKDVTARDVLNAMPAKWDLEHWASTGEVGVRYPRPRFQEKDVVVCFFGSIEDMHRASHSGNSAGMELGVIVAVGFRDESWNVGMYVTYVVQVQDGRLLTLVIDDDRIRLAVPADKREEVIGEVGNALPIQIEKEKENLDFL